MNCYFATASYKRAENQRTVAYLERLGIEKEKIIVTVQTEEDFKEYTRQGIDKRVGRLIYREGKNVSDNRNTILDNIPIGEKVVIFDDDITAVSKWNRENRIKTVYQYNLEGNLVATYDSCKECSQYFNTSEATISRYCNQHKPYKNYILSY